MAKKYNSIRTEALRLGVSERTLERRCRDESFPYIRVGTRLIFDPDLTDQYLTGRVHGGRQAQPTTQMRADKAA